VQQRVGQFVAFSQEMTLSVVDIGCSQLSSRPTEIGCSQLSSRHTEWGGAEMIIGWNLVLPDTEVRGSEWLWSHQPEKYATDIGYSLVRKSRA
jgi:hypothetical protein